MSQRRWRPLIGVVGTLLTASVAVTLTTAPVAAHTDFVGSDPRDGARLDGIPGEVLLEFSDEMDPQLSTVTARVDSGDNTPLEVTSGANRTVLAAAIPDALTPPDGSSTRWTVTFRVVSDDGHPVVGTTQFYVPVPSTPSPSAPGGDDAATDSDPSSTETTEGAAASEADPDRADDQAAWPLVALGVGALLLLLGAVGATMRLVGRDRDK